VLAASAYGKKEPAVARVAAGAGVGVGRSATSELKGRVEAAIARSNFAEAHHILDDSYRQAPQSEKLYLLGRLAQAEGCSLDAVDLFRRFLADPGAETMEAQEVAQKAVALPRPLIGEVIVQGERGWVLSVDERPVGVLPLPTPLLLSPGPHKLVISLGNKRQEELYKVLASRTAELRFNLSSDVVVATLQPAAVLLIVPTSPDGAKEPATTLTTEERGAIEQAVARAAAAKQLGIQDQTAALVAAPQLANCLSESRCQFSLAEENQATLLLLAQVEVGSRWRTGRELKLRLIAFDTAVAEQAAMQERTCESCGAVKAGEVMAELSAQVLSTAVGRPRGTLLVQSVPDGAAVYLNGKLLGQTPLKRPSWAGTFPLVIRKKGFSPTEREVTIAVGQRQTVDVTLLLQTAATNEAARKVIITEGEPVHATARPRWRIITGATAIGIGAVVLGFGISALAVNSRCVAGLGDPNVQCPRVYDTVTPGAALTAVGGAALVTGTMLLAWPPPSQ
jgi:hypothetical protein